MTPTDLVPPATGLRSADPLSGGATSRPLTKTEEGEKFNIINAIVAEVNGEVITREDLLRNIRGRMPLWSTQNAEEFSQQVRLELRERLQIEIRWQLLLQEARKQVKEEQTKAIDKEIEKERQRQIAASGGSQAKWREKLAETGATEETWKKAQVESILVNEFMATTFDPKISITRQDLVEHYEKVKKAKYELPTQARMQLIKLWRGNYPSPEALAARAKSLANRARAGEDFNKLAAENLNEDAGARNPGQENASNPTVPNGTDYGLLRKGSIKEEAVEKALFSLPVGSVSDPIYCDRYVYIIKVLERRESRTVPFTEVQEEVTNEVRRAKRMKMVGDYVNNLSQKAFIKVHEENL
jgi:parvulin-like peptidyl-prolyl isomerase